MVGSHALRHIILESTLIEVSIIVDDDPLALHPPLVELPLIICLIFPDLSPLTLLDARIISLPLVEGTVRQFVDLPVVQVFVD